MVLLMMSISMDSLCGCSVLTPSISTNTVFNIPYTGSEKYLARLLSPSCILIMLLCVWLVRQMVVMSIWVSGVP